MEQKETNWMYRDGSNYKFPFVWETVFPEIPEPTEILPEYSYSLDMHNIDAENLHDRLVDAGVKKYVYDDEIDHNFVEYIGE